MIMELVEERQPMSGCYSPHDYPSRDIAWDQEIIFQIRFQKADSLIVNSMSLYEGIVIWIQQEHFSISKAT